MDDFLMDFDEESEDENGSLYAKNVDEFVETFIRVHYETPILDTSGTIRWCNRWKDHPQAILIFEGLWRSCLLYTSPSPRDQRGPRMPSSA